MAASDIAAKPSGHDGHEFCDKFAPILVAPGRQDLLMSFSDVCMPFYANTSSDASATSMYMMRSLVGAASGADDKTLNAIIERLETLPTWGNAVEEVTSQLWWSKKGAQIVSVASGLTPEMGVSADKMRHVYAQAFDKSLVTPGLDPMAVWSEAIARVGFFDTTWMPKGGKPFSEVSLKFLDRLIAERPAELVAYARDVDEDRSERHFLLRIDQQRLWKLYQALNDTTAKAEV